MAIGILPSTKGTYRVASAEVSHYLIIKEVLHGLCLQDTWLGAVYFLTITVNKWVDVLTRKAYCDIVLDSLNFCVEKKALDYRAPGRQRRKPGS
jgi:hypothetical protein